MYFHCDSVYSREDFWRGIGEYLELSPFYVTLEKRTAIDGLSPKEIGKAVRADEKGFDGRTAPARDVSNVAVAKTLVAMQHDRRALTPGWCPPPCGQDGPSLPSPEGRAALRTEAVRTALPGRQPPDACGADRGRD